MSDRKSPGDGARLNSSFFTSHCPDERNLRDRSAFLVATMAFGYPFPYSVLTLLCDSEPSVEAGHMQVFWRDYVAKSRRKQVFHLILLCARQDYPGVEHELDIVPAKMEAKIFLQTSSAMSEHPNKMPRFGVGSPDPSCVPRPLSALRLTSSSNTTTPHPRHSTTR